MDVFNKHPCTSVVKMKYKSVGTIAVIKLMFSVSRTGFTSCWTCVINAKGVAKRENIMKMDKLNIKIYSQDSFLSLKLAHMI